MEGDLQRHPLLCCVRNGAPLLPPSPFFYSLSHMQPALTKGSLTVHCGDQIVISCARV